MAVAMSNAREIVLEIARAVAEEGGRALVVGGSVRDDLLGIAPKDFDIEVYGIAEEKVGDIARRFGVVSDVGKAFAILKLVVDGVDIDIALPRREVKIGEGHRGFSVIADPGLSPQEALRRRDFTINAIAQDPLTGEVLDPFHGRKDLEERVLRVVDAATFVEDPLRILRAMQLVGRFGLKVDSSSFVLMQSMAETLREISPERIGDEWRKLLLKSEVPSLGLDFGMRVGAFAVLHPELVELDDTPQEPEWHPEGNVWVHTMWVVDEAAKIARREALDDAQALVVLLGALCHDIGKPTVTCTMDGRIRSPGHEEAGEAPTRRFLKALYVQSDTIDRIVGIVKDHMKPYRYWLSETAKGEPIGDGAIRRLAARIAPATLRELVMVTEADYKGRGPFPNDPLREYHAATWLLARADALGVAQGPAASVVTGTELLELGYAPGPHLGEIMRLANDLRDEKDWCHYNVLDALREIAADVQGSRDPREAIARLKYELD